MSMPADVDLSTGATALGVLALRGSDAARFLQGQLSANLETLPVGASTLAGFHNPQGRVIALLAVLRLASDEFLAVLPRELTTNVASRLGKFVLRSRVRISDESQVLRVLGTAGMKDRAAAGAIAWGDRQLLLVPFASGRDDLSTSLATWERADIAAGLPQVYAATSETFVAQMLNLDLLGAIAFDKGCYTGQEVIARAHYRGRVKRRLQRWRAHGVTELKPGDAVRSSDGRALTVVRSVADDAAGCELLAVGPFDAGPAAEDSADEVRTQGIPVEGPLPLPYDLPA